MKKGRHKLKVGEFNNCRAGHKKHDRLIVDTVLGKMTVYDYKKYMDFPGYCTGQDAISNTITNSGAWEHAYFKPISKILRDGDKSNLVIDIGCHIGWYSKMAANAGYEVIAFDGDKENLELLKLNVPSAHSAHIWFEKDMKTVFNCDQEVELMKIDIEGAEEHAIHYMRMILPKTKNVFMEITPIFNDSYPELVKTIIKMGFDVFEYDGIPFNFNYDFDQKDLLFKRRQ